MKKNQFKQEILHHFIYFVLHTEALRNVQFKTCTATKKITLGAYLHRQKQPLLPFRMVCSDGNNNLDQWGLRFIEKPNRKKTTCFDEKKKKTEANSWVVCSSPTSPQASAYKASDCTHMPLHTPKILEMCKKSMSCLIQKASSRATDRTSKTTTFFIFRFPCFDHNIWNNEKRKCSSFNTFNRC